MTADRQQTANVEYQTLRAVRQAADVLCDRWSLSILLLMFCGVQRSGEFQERTGIASRQLTQRLQSLESRGLVVRMPYSSRPLRYGAYLTPMGTELFDVFATMLTWVRHCGDPQRAGILLHHRNCASDCAKSGITPRLVCGHCQVAIHARDVEPVRKKNDPDLTLPEKKNTYRRVTNNKSRSARILPLQDCIEIVGDKWTIEILVLAFMRLGDFSAFERELGIATNILTDRLRLLTDLDVFRLSTPGEDRRKNSYRLSEKGVAFYPVLLALQAWADRWLPGRLRSPLQLMHMPCGNSLNLRMACSRCDEMIGMDTCEFRLSA